MCQALYIIVFNWYTILQGRGNYCSLSVYSVPGTVLGVLEALVRFLTSVTLWGKFYSLPFTDEKNEP